MDRTPESRVPLAGALQTAFLLLAVWWVWMYTCWFTNWIDPDRPTVRMLMFLLMLSGLLMSAAIPNAFGHEGLLFASAYSFIQVVRTLFIVVASRHRDPVVYRNFLRIITWLLASAVVWIAGGLMSGAERVLTWVVALSLEIFGPFLGYFVPGLGRSSTSDWKIDGSHMAERCSLFVIIALGESILVTGATAAGLGLLVLLAPVATRMTPLMLSAATTVVLIVVAVWETRSFSGAATSSASGSPRHQ